MARCCLVSTVALLATFLGVHEFRAAAGADQRPAAVSEPQLLQRIERLETRVAELEKRQGSLGGPILTPPPAEFRVVPNGSVPPGWIPREFNGLRYYDIPLDRGHK